LTVNGVSQDMKDYFWTYALGKAKSTGTTGGGPWDTAQARQGNLSIAQLQAEQPLTQTQYKLAGQLQGAYIDMATANQTMNTVMGQLTTNIIPKMMIGGPLSYMRDLPSAFQDMLFQFIDATRIGNIVGSGATAASIYQALQGNAAAGAGGDVGDIGQSLSGLHPDMQKRVGAMMAANPSIRINSGLRDRGMQGRMSGRFAKGQMSPHMAGMAADLGPRSQYGWIAANASKFGLDAAGRYGEPWHVQRMGTLSPLRTPTGASDVGDAASDALTKMFGGDMLTQMLTLAQSLTSSGVPDPMAALSNAVGMLSGMLTGTYGQQNYKPNQGPTYIIPSLTVPSSIAVQSTSFQSGAGINVQGVGPVSGGLSGGRASVPVGSLQTLSNGPGGRQGTYIKGQQLTWNQLMDIAYNAGWRGSDLIEAMAIADRETSRGSYRYAYVPSTKDKSYGLWMMNGWTSGESNQLLSFMQAAGGTSLSDYYDPNLSAKAAYQMWKADGWGPWTTYGGVNHPIPQASMNQAAQTVQSAGLGDVSMATAPMDHSYNSFPQGRGQTVLHFHNTFNIGGGPGAGSTSVIPDVRRAASQMADSLEQQMRQRVTRTF
jgi:hypothetical protein